MLCVTLLVGVDADSAFGSYDDDDDDDDDGTAH